MIEVATQRLRALFREPLVQFLSAALVLFSLNALFSSAPVDDSRVIRIDDATLQWLAESSTKERNKEPSPVELETLLEGHVKEEILYREALALGMDKDDVIIRRRLIEKMRFLIEDVAGQNGLSEEGLREFYNKNRDQFTVSPRLSFSHYYFSHAAYSENPQQVAQALNELQADSSGVDERHSLGEPFMSGYHFADHSEAKISGLFGRHFYENMASQAVGRWLGPIESAYGQHLVKITHRQESYIPDFDEAKEEVRRTWQAQNREESNHSAYQKMRENYEVIYAPVLDTVEQLEIKQVHVNLPDVNKTDVNKAIVKKEDRQP